MRHEMFREMLAENNYESDWLRVMILERGQRFLGTIGIEVTDVIRICNDCMTSGNVLPVCCM
jgi:hypothetical protein